VRKLRESRKQRLLAVSSFPSLVSDHGLAKANIVGNVLIQGLFAVDVRVDLAMKQKDIINRHECIRGSFKIEILENCVTFSCVDRYIDCRDISIEIYLPLPRNTCYNDL